MRCQLVDPSFSCCAGRRRARRERPRGVVRRRACRSPERSGGPDVVSRSPISDFDVLGRDPAGPENLGASSRCSRRSCSPRRSGSRRRRARRRARDRGDPPRSSSTWAALVGLTWPNLFADGATTPPPKASSMDVISGWAGTRTATLSRPPVTSSSTRWPRRRSSVSGPGQHVAASTSAAGGISPTQLGEQLGAEASGRSVGGTGDGPSPGRHARPPLRGSRHRRRGRRPSRWASPPAHPPAARAGRDRIGDHRRIGTLVDPAQRTSRVEGRCWVACRACECCIPIRCTISPTTTCSWSRACRPWRRASTSTWRRPTGWAPTSRSSCPT